MKVAVITRHAIINYGSLLQTIATQKVIEGLGYECEIIDYVRPQEDYKNIERSLLKNKKDWSGNLFKKVVYLSVRQPESVFAGKKFEKERQSYLRLSKRYTTLDKLKEDVPEADIFMTGSDQVWGPVEDGSYDEAYALAFTDKKKIAYAASFGHSTLTDSVKDYYKERLSEYCYITVREDSAVKLLDGMGIESMQVLDPTLLLSADFWNQYLEPIKKSKYILVYQIHNNKKLDEYAKKVSKSIGLPLIRVTASFHQIVRAGRLVLCPNIGEFLSYIKNAECLITDSFHGTAFAINFHVPFVEVLPCNDTGTRNVSILKLTGLTDRILDNTENISLADKNIDYATVKSILEEERIKSLEILKMMVNA